ncbi:transposase domain-containing protein [Sphingomonas sp. CJ99]
MASRAVEYSVPTATVATPDPRLEWYSAAELEALALPGLPGDKRSINRRADQDRWINRTGPDGLALVRPRAGRGGGVEYHVTLLPAAARLELERRASLLRQTEAPAIALVRAETEGGWRWLEAQSGAVRAEAERRLAIVNQILLLESAGMTRTAAIAHVMEEHGVSRATLWNWLGLIDGLASSDRLPALAPRRKGGGRAAEIDPRVWQYYKSYALSLSKPSLTHCYERTAEYAVELGLSMPAERTMRRRFEREVEPAIRLLKREGEEALRRSIPAERRTVEHLSAMEVVNIDGHKFDVWVIPPEGGDPVRPIMVAIQDVRSSKIVGWRLGLTESTTLARLAVADMLKNFGIPKRMTSDNGRAFASKLFSGGQTTRFRFSILENEPTGLMTALGVEINWAIPGRGQSKPIERAFRDLADRVSRAPECEGAYTGPNPLAKPENYRTKAMPWEAFRAHVERCVNRHNARLGRTGRDYRGRSFDQVFIDTLRDVGRATPEHLRLALLAHDQVRVNRQTGEISLFGNRYWADGMDRLRGQLVTVRFDPEQLHGDVHLYDGPTYLLTAQLIADSPWGTVDGAKSAAKRAADYRRKIREGVEAEQLLTSEQLAAMSPGVSAPAIPEPPALRPVRHRGNVAIAAKPIAETRAEAAAKRESRVFGALRVIEGGE